MRLSLLVAVLAAALTGCEQPGPDVRTNVILISIDSLRSDHLGAYGYERPTSPNIDRLAARGVVFERARSTTTWTLPSHLSLLTGLYPEVHGVQRGKRRVSSRVVLCSEVFSKLGYETAALVAAPYLHRRFGFAQGFDEYDDYTIGFENHAASHQGATSPILHARIREMLDDLGQGPFFLFLHYWDPHYDYNPPAPYDSLFDPDYEGTLTAEAYLRNPRIHADMEPRDLEHVIALYDGEIRFTDHYIGELLNELERRELLQDALVVLTSDHGQEFFEHGGKAHRRNLYDETLRVPLIFKFPGGRFAGERRAEPASLVDVVPTLLDALNLEPLRLANGRSLLPVVRGERPPSPRYFADLHGELKAVVEGRRKFIAGAPGSRGPAELYDLQEDPGEQSSLSQTERASVSSFRGVLADWLRLAARHGSALASESFEYDPELRQALESLGYVD